MWNGLSGAQRVGIGSIFELLDQSASTGKCQWFLYHPIRFVISKAARYMKNLFLRRRILEFKMVFLLVWRCQLSYNKYLEIRNVVHNFSMPIQLDVYLFTKNVSDKLQKILLFFSWPNRLQMSL